MSWYELITSLELGLIYGIAAMGIYLTFRVIDFPDLTCDGSFVLGAAVSAMLLKHGFSAPVSLAFALLSGALAGFCTGILHMRVPVSNLMSGILMAFMLYSINLKVMQGMPNVALLDVSSIFGNVNACLILGIIACGVWAVVGYLLNTDFGLAMQTLGQNPLLAKNCGINIARMTIVMLILSNALIAFSGALFAQHQGFADVSQGVGTIIIGLAGVMLGEKIFPYRNLAWALLACVLGSIIYRLLVAGALHSEWLNLQTQDLNLITGIMIVLIMFAPKLKGQPYVAAK